MRHFISTLTKQKQRQLPLKEPQFKLLILVQQRTPLTMQHIRRSVLQNSALNTNQCETSPSWRRQPCPDSLRWIVFRNDQYSVRADGPDQVPGTQSTKCWLSPESWNLNLARNVAYRGLYSHWTFTCIRWIPVPFTEVPSIVQWQNRETKTITNLSSTLTQMYNRWCKIPILHPYITMSMWKTSWNSLKIKISSKRLRARQHGCHHLSLLTSRMVTYNCV